MMIRLALMGAIAGLAGGCSSNSIPVDDALVADLRVELPGIEAAAIGPAWRSEDGTAICGRVRVEAGDERVLEQARMRYPRSGELRFFRHAGYDDIEVEMQPGMSDHAATNRVIERAHASFENIWRSACEPGRS